MQDIPGYVWDAERQRYFRILPTGAAPPIQPPTSSTPVSNHRGGNNGAELTAAGTNLSRLSFNPGPGDRHSHEKLSISNYTKSALAAQKRKKERQRINRLTTAANYDFTDPHFDLVRAKRGVGLHHRLNPALPMMHAYAHRLGDPELFSSIANSPHNPMALQNPTEFEQDFPTHSENLDEPIGLVVAGSRSSVVVMASKNGALSLRSDLGEASTSSRISLNSLSPTQPNFHDSITAMAADDQTLSIATASNEMSGRIHVLSLPHWSLIETYSQPEIPICTSRGMTGTDSGLYIKGNFLSTDSGVCAVEKWCAGCRNGKLLVTDNRSGSRAVAWGKHISGVTRLQTVDSNQVVVAGVEDHMALWDRRYPQRPIFMFPSYANWCTPRHGLVLDPSHKLTAVSCDDGSIRIYDVKTGALLLRPLASTNSRTVVPLTAWSQSGLYFAYKSDIYKCNNGTQGPESSLTPLLNSLTEIFSR